MLRKLAVILMTATTLLIPLAATGNAKGTTCATPTMTGQATVAVGDVYTITGCGFSGAPRKDSSIEVAIRSTEPCADGTCVYNFPVVLSHGSFSYQGIARFAGTYSIEASNFKTRSSPFVTVASFSFTAS